MKTKEAKGQQIERLLKQTEKRRDMIAEEVEYETRLQWFKDRIGKRVYRASNGCDCPTCENIAKNGLIVADLTHAVYLLDVEAISAFEGEDEKIVYQDNPLECKDTTPIKEQ